MIHHPGRTSLALATLAVVVLLGGCARKPESAPTETSERATAPVRVGLNKYLSNAPIMIAQDRGYFREEGVDVELVPGGDPPVLYQALLRGDLEVVPTLLSPSILNMILRGATIRVVADKGFLDPDGCTANALVARTDLVDSGALDAPGGLRGRRIGFQQLGTFGYLLEMVVEQHGLTMDDIVKAPAPQYTTVDDLTHDGGADLRFASEPMLTRVKDAHAGKVWLPLERVAPGFSMAAVVYGPRLLDDPDLGARFMRGYLRGVADARKGATDTNVAIAAKYTKLDEALLRRACWTPLKADGLVDLEQLDAYASWCWRKGYIDGPIDHTRIWDGRFVEQAKSR